jgi:hypothetical protein
MANNSDKGKYWPYMILGFLAIGITLGYWTVKHAIGMPVHESNEYMLKYQAADEDANAILEAQKRFDARYDLKLEGLQPSHFKPRHLKRKHGQIVALNRENSFAYVVTDKAGKPVSDANVSLLVTRPFTEKEDQHFDSLPYKEGSYRVDHLKLANPGRYILRVRVQKGDAVGFQDTEAYLAPQK